MSRVSRETMGGWSLIVGAVMGLVTMALHPSDVARPLLSVAVHTLAMAGAPVTLYGGWVLSRRLSVHGALSELALAFFGVSTVATLLAATVSGLVAPELVAWSDAAGDALRAYNYALNQGFAKVLVAASSMAIGLWSVEIVRTRSMNVWTGVMGCVVAPLTLVALSSGHLTLDVHGFGAVVLGQAIWLILVGSELCAGS